MLNLVKKIKRGDDKILANRISFNASSGRYLNQYGNYLTIAHIDFDNEQDDEIEENVCQLSLDNLDGHQLVEKIALLTHSFAYEQATGNKNDYTITHDYKRKLQYATAAKWLRDIADKIEKNT